MMLSHRDIVLRTVFRANKISLRPEGVAGGGKRDDTWEPSQSRFASQEAWFFSVLLHLIFTGTTKNLPLSGEVPQRGGGGARDE